jgi:hypothetical protein
MSTLGLLFVLQSMVFCHCAHGQILDAMRSLFTRDPLIRAIDKGLKPGGDLALELCELDDVLIDSPAHAEAILRAVAKLPLEPIPESEAWNTAEYEVASLFQEVNGRGCVAYSILSSEGIPALIDLYRKLLILQEHKETRDEDREDALLCILETCALYHTREGTDLVISAARSKLLQDAWRWYSVFGAYEEEHPHREILFEELGNQLPNGYAAVALLNTANSIALEQDTFSHPFASAAGAAKMKKWLSSEDEDDFGDAYSASVALAFISADDRAALLEIAHDHPDGEVRVEAAWAAAHAGDETGLQRLRDYCLDVHVSSLAQTYLEEFDREDLIPAKAKEPDFAAKAEFSRWLQHPNELARAPDELEIVDQRELIWYDSDEPRLFTILRYRADGETPLDEEDTGIGLVGSMTWSFFMDHIEPLPPEDVYAIHCTFEAINTGKIKEIDSPSDRIADRLLQQWTGEPLGDVQMNRVLRMKKKLEYPQRYVGCAEATLGSEKGFAVFDDQRSRWYPASQFPDSTDAWVSIRIHVGRQLLGFAPTETRVLRPIHRRKPTREEFVRHYENLLEEAQTATSDRKVELIDGSGPLGRHFEAYIETESQLSQRPREDVILEMYERLLAIALTCEGDDLSESLDSFSVVGEQFELYTQTIAEKQPQKVAELIDRFEPYWEHNLGWSRLGRAAYRAGLRGDAKRFLELLIEQEDVSMHTGDGSRMLADIWHVEGQVEKARQRLTDAIRQCEAELSESTYSEYRDDLRNYIDGHKAKYKELFGVEFQSAGKQKNSQ